MTKEVLKERAINIIDTAKTELRDLTEDEAKEIDGIKEEIKSIDEEEKEETTPEDTDENTDKEVVNEDEENKEDVEEVSEEKEENNKNNISNIRKTMNKDFRLIKAIRDVANNRSLDEVTKAVANAGAEEMRKSGLSFGGQIQLPLESRTITVQGEGGVHDDIIETEFTNILEPLRAKNVLVEAGAKYLTNLVGDVQIPVMTKTNVGWAGEIEEAVSGTPTFDHVTLSPKRLTAYIDLSKQFLVQDSLGAEQLIREDIVKALNAKLEETILSAGSGDTKTPEGIFNVVSATSVSGFSDVCEKEAELEDANVYGEKIYLMSNKAKAAFRVMAKSTKSTQLVMENGEIDGTKALNTSMIAGKNYIYGDFSNLVIGQFGGIDLLVDPYTKAASGQVRIVINAYFDAKVVRPEAFTAGTLA